MAKSLVSAGLSLARRIHHGIVRRGIRRRLRYLWARLRQSQTVIVRGVAIEFPIVGGTYSAFHRVLEAPQKEPATQQWLEDISRTHPGATLWDVGANIGLFTLLAGRMGLNVVAFEPLLTSQQLLQLSVPLNGLEESIVSIPIGLSSHTSTTDFFIRSPRAGVSGSSMGVSIAAPQYRFATLAMSGDDVRKLLPSRFNSPTAIKLDVDGIELQILEGLKETLATESLQHIMVEEDEDEANVASVLAPHGFRLTHEENTTPRRPGMYVNRYFSRTD